MEQVIFNIPNDVIRAVRKSLTLQKTPPRSRANSVGTSQEDPSAPPTEEIIREIRIQLHRELQLLGLINNEPSQQPKNFRKTEIVP